MAKPVAYRKFVPAVSREETARKVQNAPIEHADAVLNGFRLLQEAHDSGTIDVVRGAMAAGDQIIDHAVELLSAPETVTALRNLFLLGKVLGNINPELLHGALGGVATQNSQSLPQRPPSIFALIRKLSSEDARRGLGVAADLLVAFGNGLAKEEGVK